MFLGLPGHYVGVFSGCELRAKLHEPLFHKLDEPYKLHVSVDKRGIGETCKKLETKEGLNEKSLAIRFSQLKWAYKLRGSPYTPGLKGNIFRFSKAPSPFLSLPTASREFTKSYWGKEKNPSFYPSKTTRNWMILQLKRQARTPLKLFTPSTVRAITRQEGDL